MCTLSWLNLQILLSTQYAKGRDELTGWLKDLAQCMEHQKLRRSAAAVSSPRAASRPAAVVDPNDADADVGAHSPVASPRSKPVNVQNGSGNGDPSGSVQQGPGLEAACAPIWQQNASAQHCLVCAAPFGIFRRKHHCRRCGCLVCHYCSTGRLVVRQNAGPERVCDQCGLDVAAAAANASGFHDRF